MCEWLYKYRYECFDFSTSINKEIDLVVITVLTVGLVRSYVLSENFVFGPLSILNVLRPQEVGMHQEITTWQISRSAPFSLDVGFLL